MSACDAEGDGSIPFEHPFLFEEEIVVKTLTRPTLVLNRIWQLVGVAFVAAYRVRIVDPSDFQQYTCADWAKLIPQDDGPIVQAVTFCLRVPEVIMLIETRPFIKTANFDFGPGAAVSDHFRNVTLRPQ
jgi:hypothetical protein